MKKIINISDNLDVEYNENKLTNRTIISVIHNDKKILLSNIKGIGEDYYTDFTYNNYYIVTFSRGNNVDGRPLVLDACYSIKDSEVIDLKDPLNNEIKNALDNIFLTRKCFSLAHVLQQINYADLGLLNEDEREELRKFLTSGNELITDDYIVEYIIKRYPELLAYMCLDNPFTVREYRMIEKELNNTTFWFNAISQDLSFIEEQKSLNNTHNLKLSRNRNH